MKRMTFNMYDEEDKHTSTHDKLFNCRQLQPQTEYFR